MAHLKQQFKDALSSIEPGDDKTNAPEAHRLVRDALKADSKLAEYGVSPILIGSYKRNVSIRRIKDVDVFVRLPDVPSDVTSTDILDRFFKVLHAEFGTDADGHRRTKRQDRSLQVSFPEYDLYVDAVPTRPYGDGTWEIPQNGRRERVGAHQPRRADGPLEHDERGPRRVLRTDRQTASPDSSRPARHEEARRILH
ncbi:hypothetical protein GA0115255_105089 [Streptomyces sp. Ncost-T6T-2b]|nr:hypothetical protein GA0115255_105089 [Streptomyces sp. Ncost-T6T-2b]